MKNKPVSVGAAMAALRWKGATKAMRSAHAAMMARKRWSKTTEKPRLTTPDEKPVDVA